MSNTKKNVNYSKEKFSVLRNAKNGTGLSGYQERELSLFRSIYMYMIFFSGKPKIR